MKLLMTSEGRSRDGSVLVTAVLILALAGFLAAAMLTAQITHSRNSDSTYNMDKAAYLADAGLQAAIVKLNAASDGTISSNDSRSYFGNTSAFTAPDWGFSTAVSISNAHNIVTSNGRYNRQQVKVQAEVSLGAGNRSLHALYAHALFAGNSAHDTNYNLSIGGTGTGADFVKGDVYSGGKIDRSGNAKLRLPELLFDTNHNSICDIGETWTNAYATRYFTNALSQAAFNAYSNSLGVHLSNGDTYGDGKYTPGEAYVDTIGNGRYDPGEPFTDVNGNGVWDAGDSFIDRNGNGVYDAGIDTVVDHGNGQYDDGEQWVEDSTHTISGKKVRVNGKWDDAGGYWKKSGNTWRWTTSSTTKSWPAESYEDVGDGVYQAAEPYIDQNGVYDVGEQYIDDRNTVYDYGTKAVGKITGMPAPGPGQTAAAGHDPAIDPPDLVHMYYSTSRASTQPASALTGWGNDVAVTASDYGTAKAITDTSKPEHIFIRNPPQSGSVSSAGKTIYGREYTTVKDTSGNTVDDYFLEDPADSTYNTYDTSAEIDGTVYTAPMYVDVKPDANMKVYYVNGNLWIHQPRIYSLRFREPGTRITIVANGNITISDEFYYNADYPAGLTRSQVSSTIVNNPSDALCLIALKNPNVSNSGNIYIGDAQFGTGGSIHAMLYAENNFVDNNINTSDQAFISIFGNMSAGNQVKLNRDVSSGHYRTRLDVTLDDRIRTGAIIVPGLPHPVGSQRAVILNTAWYVVPGTWNSWSSLR